MLQVLLDTKQHTPQVTLPLADMLLQTPLEELLLLYERLAKRLCTDTSFKLEVQ